MAEKKSFLLYISSFKQIRKLTQEQKGNLLDAIMNFQEDVPLPEMDPLVDMCFGFIADDMQRDAEKYEEIVEKRRESGRKGGKTTQANQANARFAQANQANATSENQANQANQAVNVNVDVDVNDNEDVDVVVNDNVPVPDCEQTTHTPTFETEQTNRPSNLDVLGEIVQHGYRLEGKSIKAFMDYNDERGWKMDWRLALKRWADREQTEQPKQNKAGKFANFPQRDDPEHKALVAKLINSQLANGGG